MLFKANTNLKLHQHFLYQLSSLYPKAGRISIFLLKAGYNRRITHWASLEATEALGTTSLPCKVESDLSSEASWLHRVMHRR